ncbi:MAG: LCP family protein [Roseburia sp.]|nr:LCP family protein [Roseburia sp.]
MILGDRKMSNKQKRKSSAKKQRAKIALIVVELFVLAILAVILYGVSKLNRIERPGSEIMDQVEVNDDIEQEVLEVTENFRTIAVFGLDNRSSGNLDSGNSDVIIVVTINNETHEVKLCSVYRDTYLDIGGGKFRKCNAAFANGGPQAAISMLNKNLDLNIEDYVTVDFGAVVECIDLVGGIELTITDEEAHYMIGYVKELNELTGNTSKVPEAGGTYILDGVQATAYSRIRYTAGNDFKRAERQRTVIAKMVEKVQQSDLKTINSIINTMFDDIETSFTNAELISLAAKVFDYQITGSVGFPFELSNAELGSKGMVVVPNTLESNVIELHKFLYDNDEYVPSTTVKANSKKIESDTGFGE